MTCIGICGRISSIAATAALTACAVGTAFVRPPEGYVHLGETTRAQIVERFGKPDEDEPRRINDQSLRVISYTYSSNAEAPKVPNTLCVRTIEFTLSGDIVVEEGFASACASDHTDFNDHRAREIVVDKTRCDQVIAMLGRPASRAVYPIAREKGELFMAYRFMYPKRPLLQLNIYQKVLAIRCGADGLVLEMEFMESGEP